jgi:hypothetical protein
MSKKKYEKNDKDGKEAKGVSIRSGYDLGKLDEIAVPEEPEES